MTEQRVISKTRQRFAIFGMVAGAFLAIGLAAAYQDDNKLGEEVNIVGGDALDGSSADTGGSASEVGGATATNSQSSGPIEGWLPKSGEASACREVVGVDLVPGYGAELTINGQKVAPEEMNVVLDDNGELTNQLTASRSIGHYTFEPEDGCPNGRWLRPTDNVLEACVYRLSDSTRRCVVRTQHSFDAL